MGKNTPVEVDARKPVGTFKEVIKPIQKTVGRDPRFSNMTGNFNQGLYEASYDWLDDLKAKEEKRLRSEAKRLRTAQRPEALERKEQVHKQLVKYKEEKRSKQKQEIERKTKREWKIKERSMVEKGKNPYFMKKSSQREAELKNKFEKLKKDGKLETFLTKQRKKQALKDAEMVPELSTFAPRRN